MSWRDRYLSRSVEFRIAADKSYSLQMSMGLECRGLAVACFAKTARRRDGYFLLECPMYGYGLVFEGFDTAATDTIH